MPGPGDIAHSLEDWEQAGAAGAVAALQLARLADEATLFTALGDDELGRRSRDGARGPRCRVHAATVAAAAALGVHPRRRRQASGRSRPSGRSSGRAVTTTRCPWHELGDADAVFFVAGDEDALAQARRARVLTATSRELDVLRRGGIELDALSGAGRTRPSAITRRPRPAAALVVSTAGVARRLVATGRAVLGGDAARRRSRTPTAPATASRPVSRTRSAAAQRPARRDRLRGALRRRRR